MATATPTPNPVVITVKFGATNLTVKEFLTKSGESTFRAVKGGKKVSAQRIPAPAVKKLAGTELAADGAESVTLEYVATRPDNARGRREDDNGNPIPWIPRTNGTIEVPTEDGRIVAVTVEAKLEGIGAETALMTVSGKFRSDNVGGGGGRKAAPTVSLDDAFSAFG